MFSIKEKNIKLVWLGLPMSREVKYSDPTNIYALHVLQEIINHKYDIRNMKREKLPIMQGTFKGVTYFYPGMYTLDKVPNMVYRDGKIPFLVQVEGNSLDLCNLLNNSNIKSFQMVDDEEVLVELKARRGEMEKELEKLQRQVQKSFCAWK